MDFRSFPQFKRETIEGYNISIISSNFENHELSLGNRKKSIDNTCNSITSIVVTALQVFFIY